MFRALVLGAVFWSGVLWIGGMQLALTVWAGLMCLVFSIFGCMGLYTLYVMWKRGRLVGSK